MEKIKLLIVDDEEDFLAPLSKRLAQRGLEVSSASDGAQAMEILAGRPVDVVVLDYKMPGMNGVEAVKAIKGKHPLVEVIMLTGHASTEAALEGMEMGAFDYLLKPCDLESLLHKIQDAHQRRCLQMKNANTP